VAREAEGKRKMEKGKGESRSAILASTPAVPFSIFHFPFSPEAICVALVAS
jgi:hypothetical protein